MISILAGQEKDYLAISVIPAVRKNPAMFVVRPIMIGFIPLTALRSMREPESSPILSTDLRLKDFRANDLGVSAFQPLAMATSLLNFVKS